jgi:RNA polymerase sigma-70 factor (ECF subfamily)
MQLVSVTSVSDAPEPPFQLQLNDGGAVSIESNETALTTLGLEQYTDALYRYALVLTRKPSEAEDLAQETYLRAYKAKGGLEHQRNIRAWLFTILRNIWFNELRRRRNGPEVDVPDWNEAVTQFSFQNQKSIHDQYVASAESKQVRAAIQQLDITFREVIILREFEEMSYRQIAEVLDTPIGTVMSRLARARTKLRELLSEDNVLSPLKAGSR